MGAMGSIKALLRSVEAKWHHIDSWALTSSSIYEGSQELFRGVHPKQILRRESSSSSPDLHSTFLMERN
jgi:hypothetical protein